MFSNRVVLRFSCVALLFLFASRSWAATPLFQHAQIYNLGMDAYAIALQDVNADGKLDLVAATLGGVGVSLGNGDGTFQSAQNYYAGGYYALSVAVGDVNGDALLDLIVGNFCLSGTNCFCTLNTNCGDGVVGVLFGNGNGTFQPVQSYDSGGVEARSVALGDLNRDGKLDLIVANSCISSSDCDHGGVAVLWGIGDGTFQAAQRYYSGGMSPVSIAVADVSGDGKLDVLVANYCLHNDKCYGSGTAGVLLGNGDGTLQAAQSYPTRNGTAITIADMNEDGRPDLLLSHFCSHNDYCGGTGMQMLLGIGGGYFGTAQSLSSGGKGATALAAQDVSRDGRLDLIAANHCHYGNTYCGGGVVGILLGNGDGTFQKVQKYYSGSSHALAVAVGDVNGDGKADVIVANGVVGVLLGTARFATTTNLNSSLNPSIYGQAVTLRATIRSNGSIAPTGTVTFRNGLNSLGRVMLNSGVATVTTAKLPTGTLSISATYKGDSDSYRSTSPATVQLVSQATSRTTIQSSLNPSLKGQPVKFVASVTSLTAKITGTVTFTADTTTLGVVLVSGAGTAKLTTNTLPKGPTIITATYNGTANIVGSAASLVQRVHE